MPFALLFFGLLLTVAGVRGTHKDNGENPGLFTLLKGDFWGPGSYTFFVAAILTIGALGYIEPLRTPSRYMLALVLLVLVLAQEKKTGGGFFAKFKQALDAAVTQPVTPPRGTQTIIPPANATTKTTTGGATSPTKPLQTIQELIDYYNGPTHEAAP